jgi:large subunit ribosomal protein L11
MAKIKLMVEGGKASTTPVMAQTLGPLKMDMNKIISDINEKTAGFKGVKVPVEVDVNEKEKTYEITVKSPPTSELIKKELGLKLGGGTPDKKKIANMAIEQLINVAKTKSEGMFVNNLRAAIKTVAGSCNSLGILIEGMESPEFNKAMGEGKFDEEINDEKTETSDEKLKELKSQLDTIQISLDKKFAKKKGKGEAKVEKKTEEEPTKEEAKEESTKKGEKK